MKELQQAIKRSGNRMHVIAKPKDELEEIIKKDVYPRPPATKDMLKPRPPVVTVMGHVDHGKTTLLDALRHSSVVDQEFGGITQHIGAFSVVLDSGARITFLDTPGHAAFTAMRERGANLTDIVVLVVAADDGVMEQTVESVRMARQANVPILVAINKIDSPKADVERTERMLVDIGIQVENLGGDVQAIPISALKRQNLDQLTEALVLQAELLEVGADPTGPVEAVIVESKLHPHKGKLSTMVVQRGTLKRGDILVAGLAMAKVRTLRDADGKQLQSVSPGYPVEIEGWRDLPSAGEQVLQVESERRARDVIKTREEQKNLEQQEEVLQVIEQKREQHDREYKEKLEMKRKMGRYKLKREGPRQPEISRDNNGPPQLNVIVKGDVDGTLEALLDTLDTYHSEDCKMEVIHYGVGSVTQNEIELAQTFKSIIYAFNVDVPGNLKPLVEQNNVDIRHFNVIYKLIDDIKAEINNRLPTMEVEEVLGEATVLQLFEINQGKKKVPVAGCRCIKGNLKRAALYKVVRNGEIIHTGNLSSMRHLKEEVDTIKSDTECGLQLLDKTVIFQPGDQLVCFQMKKESPQTDWDPGF
ncbi:translation initiation factor IF-2, mitochondrial isoform X2 [Aethina tumida]|nr:translation initiation factor IF-2, mitochondrial isoform X2 [Aethina tumida]